MTATPTPTRPATPTPSTTSTPSAAAVAIPTNCRSLVSAAYYAANFAATPLNDTAVLDASHAGAVTPVTPAAGSTTAQVLDSAAELRCAWRDPAADLTSLLVTVAHADAAFTTPYLTSLAGQGYTCTATSDGHQCRKISVDPYYPANDAQTVFVRDGVCVSVVEGNYRGENGLIANIASTLWP